MPTLSVTYSVASAAVCVLWRYIRVIVWLGGVVVMALDLRLEIAGSVPAAALSSATLDKLFTYIVQLL